MCVYLDDLACGIIIEGNIFRKVQRGIVIGGGRDNMVIENVFEDCRRSSVRIEYRESTAENSERILRERLNAVPYQEDLWEKKYPKLKNILNDEPFAPKNNIIENNLYVDQFDLEINSKARKMQRIRNNKKLIGIKIDDTNEKLGLDSINLMNKNIKIPFERIGKVH